MPIVGTLDGSHSTHRKLSRLGNRFNRGHEYSTFREWPASLGITTLAQSKWGEKSRASYKKRHPVLLRRLDMDIPLVLLLALSGVRNELCHCSPPSPT